MAEPDTIIPIPRRLARQAAKSGAWEIIDQSEIADIVEPVIILGDPGLGKSTLAAELGALPGFSYIRAGTFARTADPRTLFQDGDCLVIDGLDEIASTAVGGGVEAVLAQLSKLGNPHFILSSREADWRGASDRIKIEDDYAHKPVLLHLQPFDQLDAQLYLARNFPNIDAAAVLDHLAARGLSEIYKNPLTLKLMGEVAAGDETLPDSRAQLLERACRVMLTEENPRHQHAGHAQRGEDELLLAAGAQMAILLLCDRAGIVTGAAAHTPEGYVHFSEIESLPLAEASADALKTRLFQAEGEGRFQPVHRVISEYLGAKWLAACFEAGVSERRIFGLFSQGDGVPTSLRGLHAWLAHFNDALADRCIAADPYAVLRYGDADTLPLSQARSLLRALKELSEADPYFRSEDWGKHPASGLLKRELKSEILAIIGEPDQHTHLTLLLIDEMAGSAVTPEVKDELEAMMFDQARYFGERSRAADALIAGGLVDDMEASVHKLLVMGDEDSHRLASELLQEVGLASVPIRLAVEIILAQIGLTISADGSEDEDERTTAYFGSKAFEKLSITELGELLDQMAVMARPLMRDAHHGAKEQVADIMRIGAFRYLDLDPALPANRLWAWVGWLRDNEGYDQEARKSFYTRLQDRPVLRRAVQAHALLESEDVRSAGYRLARTGLGLYPDSKDVAALIEAFERRGDTPLDLEALGEIVQLDRRKEGLSDSVREAASRIGAGDGPFLTKLAEWSKPLVYEYEAKDAERRARAEAERQAVHKSFRDEHAKRATDVAAGDVGLLSTPAKAYLGRYSEFSRDDPPDARVRVFLGNGLGEQALEGFVAVLEREDLPSARAIAQSHAKGKCWRAEEPMVCGIAERLRRDRGLGDLSPATIAAAFMAWRRAGESNILGRIDMSADFETAALNNDALAEEFFRTSIEPQLETGHVHVYDLYFLANDARWARLAGRLAIEWLDRFETLPEEPELELLHCAARHGIRADLRALAISSRDRVHRNYSTMLAWLAMDFVFDFEASTTPLAQAAADDSDFFWFLRNRVAGERDDAFQRLSIAQRAFLIDGFGDSWPKTDRPQGPGHGDSNPWDASAFIERMAYSIASEPDAEATETLKRLIAEAAPTYEDPLRHALALQRKVRLDHDYTAPSVARLRAVMANALPESIDDMRAFFGDRISVVQARMHGSNTDMWEAYWDGAKPRGENFCRNRLVEYISGQLPEAVRFEPEMHMPAQKRADIAAIHGKIGLPVEIKGQWHLEVWTAPVDQLAAKYGRDWHAEGRGAYIVLWFGRVPGKALPAHPDGLPPPESPGQLQAMLVDRLPEPLRSLIDVYVIDVSRLTPPPKKRDR
jgi:hypothetical protein